MLHKEMWIGSTLRLKALSLFPPTHSLVLQIYREGAAGGAAQPGGATGGRVIIFTTLRESVNSIVALLKRKAPLITPRWGRCISSSIVTISYTTCQHGICLRVNAFSRLF